MTSPSASPAPLSPRTHRRRFTPLAIITGVVSAVILALSMNTSLAAFTASITNSVNTVGTGSLVMEETSGASTCLSSDGANNAYTCTTINKYGGTTTPLAPGDSATTTVTIHNTGTTPATTFTVAPQACTQTGTGTATDFCAQVRISISQDGTVSTAANATLNSIANTTVTLAAPLAPDANSVFEFTVSLPTSLGNTYQNLAASQPLVWTFTS